MRLFTAVNFHEEVKKELKKIQEKLIGSSAQGRFPEEDNFHLTLVFIGETGEERIGQIIAEIDKVRARPFTLEFNGVGKFGDTWWVGIKNGEALDGLYNELYQGLSGALFKLENRPYKPHITLGREVKLLPKSDLEEIKRYPELRTEVKEIYLMNSARQDNNLKYIPIYCKKLR
jgi:2''-5'' RNA ligase